MSEELFTIRGETDGTSTSGTVPLDSTLFYSTVTFFRIPKGMKAKIWFKKVSGAAVTFRLEYTYDVTVASPTWKPIEVEYLASAGEISIEKRRPLILRSFNGTEAFRVTWTQTAAGKSYVELGVELSEE